jgi:hypothetical protein
VKPSPFSQIVLFALFLLLAACSQAPVPKAEALTLTAQATRTVTSTADAGPGSLRQAIADAAPGDTIGFSLAGCPCTITLTTGELVISKDLTIQGPGADLLSVSGNNASRVFSQTDATVTISGLTITGGNGVGNNGGGGGVLSIGGTLTLNDSVVTGNSVAGAGGGIAAVFGTLNLNRTTVSGNSATEAGGIYAQDNTTIIRDSTISGNSGPHGEGLRSNAASDNATMMLINSTVSGNTAADQNSALRSEAYSGWTSTVTVINSTITNNRTTGAGQNGAIWIRPLGGTHKVTLHNTIVSGNTSGGLPNDVEGTLEPASANNLIGTGGGLTGGVNGNIVGVNDPLLGALGDNGGPTQTHALLLDSPSLDKGNNALAVDEASSPLVNDQRGAGFGRRRVVGGTVDIGAFESPLEDTTPPVITANVSGTLGSDDWYTSDVSVSWTVTDEESTVLNQTGCEARSVTTDSTGVTLTCETTTSGGTATQSVSFKRDATAPSLSPVVSPNTVLVNAPATAVSNASDAFSGLASESCGSVTTSSVGSKSVSCSARDKAGNSASASASYQVIYNFRGFFVPVQNAPALNRVKAGWVVPFSFNLGGNFGKNVITKTESSPISCSTLAPQGSASPTQQGSSYSQSSEQARSAWGVSSNLTSSSYSYTLYVYLWKTDTAWKNTCRQFTLTLNDGTTHQANFKFR